MELLGPDGRRLIASTEAILKQKIRDLTSERDQLLTVCRQQLVGLKYFKRKIAELEARLKGKKFPDEEEIRG